MLNHITFIIYFPNIHIVKFWVYNQVNGFFWGNQFNDYEMHSYKQKPLNNLKMLNHITFITRLLK